VFITFMFLFCWNSGTSTRNAFEISSCFSHRRKGNYICVWTVKPYDIRKGSAPEQGLCTVTEWTICSLASWGHIRYQQVSLLGTVQSVLLVNPRLSLDTDYTQHFYCRYVSWRGYSALRFVTYYNHHDLYDYITLRKVTVTVVGWTCD
jgi:hypothetical protein